MAHGGFSAKGGSQQQQQQDTEAHVCTLLLRPEPAERAVVGDTAASLSSSSVTFMDPQHIEPHVGGFVLSASQQGDLDGSLSLPPPPRMMVEGDPVVFETSTSSSSSSAPSTRSQAARNSKKKQKTALKQQGVDTAVDLPSPSPSPQAKVQHHNKGKPAQQAPFFRHQQVKAMKGKAFSHAQQVIDLPVQTLGAGDDQIIAEEISGLLSSSTSPTPAFPQAGDAALQESSSSSRPSSPPRAGSHYHHHPQQRFPGNQNSVWSDVFVHLRSSTNATASLIGTLKPLLPPDVQGECERLKVTPNMTQGDRNTAAHTIRKVTEVLLAHLCLLGGLSVEDGKRTMSEYKRLLFDHTGLDHRLRKAVQELTPDLASTGAQGSHHGLNATDLTLCQGLERLRDLLIAFTKTRTFFHPPRS